MKQEGKAWIEQRGHKGKGTNGKEVDLEKNTAEAEKKEENAGDASISEKGTLVDETAAEKVKEEEIVKEIVKLPQ